MARPEDGDEAQAPRVAHRALLDVHARQAEQEGLRFGVGAASGRSGGPGGFGLTNGKKLDTRRDML